MKKNNKIKVLFISIFAAIILILLVFNIDTVLSNFNNDIKTNGLVQKTLNRKLIGNFDYYKDNKDVMNMFSVEQDVTIFANDVIRLNELMKDKNVPLVYVQIPARQFSDYSEISSENLRNEAKDINDIVMILKKNGVDCIDIREELLVNNLALNYENVFLETDVHMQTDAEIWVGNLIIDYCEENYGMEFSNQETVFNMENYEKHSYKFLGNLPRPVGEYYGSTDVFDLYYPFFETSFVLKDENFNILKQGDFSNTVMNSMDVTSEPDLTTYWPIDYMQYEKPLYIYENNIVEKNNILVIMDSMTYRAISYLSLLTSNVTVLDSRFFNGQDYLTKALDYSEYDLVIVAQKSSLLGTHIFID